LRAAAVAAWSWLRRLWRTLRRGAARLAMAMRRLPRARWLARVRRVRERAGRALRDSRALRLALVGALLLTLGFVVLFAPVGSTTLYQRLTKPTAAKRAAHAKRH
jgi:hypothetical protein